MANQIIIVDRVEYQRDAVPSNPDLKSYRYAIDTTSDAAAQISQTVGTSHVALAVGGVTDDALARIRNLSTTATLTIGGDASTVFVPWFSIPPGEEASMPRVESLADTYIRASAASTEAMVTLYKIVAPA
jgi:chemotaxis response regulator CheB